MRATLHYDPPAEKAFIGSLFLLVNDEEFDAAHNAAFALGADDLYSPELVPIFAAFRRLLQCGQPFDQTILLSELNGSVENPAAVLLEASYEAKTASYIDSYVDKIRKSAEQRRAVCIVNDGFNELSKAKDASAVHKIIEKLSTVAAPTIPDAVIPTDRYTPFPLETLPVAVGNYVAAASKAIGCDASFIALPLLGCLARAIGNKRVIRLKRTWTEPAIIWAAIIGRSGTHKTPALQAATSFLNKAQAKSITDFQQATSKFSQDMALYDRDYLAWKKSKSTEPPPWKPEEPACERFITTDCTIEALASLLHSQFDGVLVPRDELSGWLGGIAEYKGGKGSDLGHWLASWSAQPLTVDRKTGAVKMIHIPRCSVSIVGGIQPDVLRRAIGHEHLQDGLCARLLLAMPDPQPVRWTDAIVDPPIEEAMTNVFDRLIGMGSGADGDGNPEPFAMLLSNGAKRLWIEYFNRHRAEAADLDDDLAAAWSKLEAYAARFALIFQLCSWAAGEAGDQAIDEAAMASGIALSDWFGGEAKRVYALFAETGLGRDRRELVELIEKRGGRITTRELAHAGRKYREAGQAEDALQNLVRSRMGRWHIEPTSRRPRREFVLTMPSTVTKFNESAEIRNNVTVTAIDRVATNPDVDEFEAARHEANGQDDSVPF
jgi:hypothetical protein